jgi:peptide/nickel transport system substrate-binding protein
MKRLRWQLVVVVLALVAIGLLLIGQRPPALETGGLLSPVQPSEGGAYSEALVGSLGRLNPTLDYFNISDRTVDRVLYSGLIRFDDRGIPYGDLAETWGISQDGKIYNFSIRSDAVWHDGQPVTSDDIAFTVELLRNDNLPLPPDLREFWKQVDVHILDEKTIQFELPEAFSPFLDYLTFGVLPMHIWQDIPPESMIDSPANLQPVGSGPFKFDKLIVEDDQIKGVELSAFSDYYERPPYFEKLVFRYYPDAQSSLAAYENGDVLGIGQVSQEILTPVLQNENIGLYSGREPRMGLVYLNLDNPATGFFKDPDIRRALLMGINRQRIIDRLLGGQAVIADGPILPGTWAYYENIEQVPYDPEGALAMLKEAGYTIPSEGGDVRAKDGVSLSFDLIYPDIPPYAEIAQAIQQDWSRLGVRANLKALPYEELLANHLDPGTYQAALVDLNLGRTPDPDPYPFWHQAQASGGQNYARWDDRQASEFLEQARVEVDLPERARLYKNFQVRFANQLPALPLYYLVQSFGVDNQVQGVRNGPFFEISDRLNSITDWFLVAKRASETPETPTKTP